jgi:hypothetical protein
MPRVGLVSVASATWRTRLVSGLQQDGEGAGEYALYLDSYDSDDPLGDLVVCELKLPLANALHAHLL